MLTIRNCQRAFSRGRASVRRSWDGATELCVVHPEQPWRQLAWVLPDSCAEAFALTHLPRWMRRYGADALLVDVLQAEAEERKKQTDVVNGATQTGHDTHGGDSASQDVPDGQSSAGALKQARRALRKQGRRGGGLSSEAHATLQGPDPTLVHTAQQLFQRLLGGDALQDTPRWDTTELVKRITTQRSLLPARMREDEGRPTLLVLPDVSGSCSSFSQPACTVAEAVAALGVPGADVLVIPHVNGRLCGVSLRLNQQLLPSDPEVDIVEAAVRTLKGPLHTIICLGDDDAVDLYETLARRADVQRLIWLDNYNCNGTEPKQIMAPRCIADWEGTVARKVTYVIGCKHEQSMLTGLRLALYG